MFLANGFNSFISKPIDIIKLDSALNKWIRDKQSAETLAMAELEGQNLSAAPDVSCGQALGGFQAEGIDLPGGISRYGEEAVYLQILRSFASNTPELLDKLRSPSPGELHDYVIAVHGLNGASLGICANELGKLAARLEALARAGDFEAVQAENDFLLRTADALLDRLNGLLQTVRDSSPATRKELMPRPDGALLQRMLDASKRSMTSVIEDTLAELEQYDYESGGEIVDWIREQIDSLEYRAIVQRLEGVDLTP